MESSPEYRYMLFNRDDISSFWLSRSDRVACTLLQLWDRIYYWQLYSKTSKEKHVHGIGAPTRSAVEYIRHNEGYFRDINFSLDFIHQALPFRVFLCILFFAMMRFLFATPLSFAPLSLPFSLSPVFFSSMPLSDLFRFSP